MSIAAWSPFSIHFGVAVFFIMLKNQELPGRSLLPSCSNMDQFGFVSNWTVHLFFYKETY